VTSRPTPDPANARDARDTLTVGNRSYDYYRLDATGADLERLPYTVKVLLENMLRHAARRDGAGERRRCARAGGLGARARPPSTSCRSCPQRVILQDFTGVPCVVDLAAMRDAMAAMGGDPARINPLVPADLVIDHSVQVDIVRQRPRLRHQRRARIRA